MNVVHDQQEGVDVRSPLDELDGRFAQPRTLELRRGDAPRHGGAAEAALEVRRERGQVRRPASVNRRRLQRARQLADQLGPQPHRGGAGQVHPGAAGHAAAVGQHPVGELGGQPGLADPSLAGDHHRPSGAASRGSPGGEQFGQLTVATDQRPSRRRRHRPRVDRVLTQTLGQPASGQ